MSQKQATHHDRDAWPIGTFIKTKHNTPRIAFISNK